MRVAALERELSAVREDRDSLVSQLHTAEAAASTTSHKVAQLEDALAEARGQHEMARADVADVHSRLHVARTDAAERIRVLEETVERLHGEVRKARDDAEDKARESAEKSGIIVALRETAAAEKRLLENKVSRLSADVSILNRSGGDLSRIEASHRDETSVLRSRLAEAEYELAQAFNESALSERE